VTARTARSKGIEVCVEATAKRAFASALAWPGWCRAGRDESAALAALAAYSARYAVVAKAARVPLTRDGEVTVVDRVPGTTTTDFGAPAVPCAVEHRPLTAAEARRLAALVAASWTVFDDVVAGAPRSLRKGPRGGGRDRDAIVEHVLAAENAYARKLGIRSGKPSRGDAAAIAAGRGAIVAALESAPGAPLADRAWLPRYAARRIAWHVLDHAWEIEDRTQG
jgi:hypothetical protein